MSAAPPDWTQLAQRAAAVIGEEEPLALTFGSGRLFVDHAGPLLAVHRCAGDDDGDPALRRRAVCHAAHRLVTSQPAYLLATGSAGMQDGVRRLARAAAEALTEKTGSLLVLEVWSPLDADPGDDVDPFDRRPGFRVYIPDDPRAEAVAGVLSDALSEIEIAGQGADVGCIAVAEVDPPGLPPLLGVSDRIVPLGLAVDAIFLNTREEEFYPGVLDGLRDALAPAVKTATEAFVERTALPARPLGRRHLEPAAETVDCGLAECARQYDFLLQVTPVNAQEAWESFRASGCEQAPELLYRPLTFDPDALRRDLFALPVRDVEDPIVARLLGAKRNEIATEVQMLLDRETQQFLSGSLRLFGTPDPDLVLLAHDIVDRLAEGPPMEPPEEIVGPTAFAAEANAELAYYRERFDGFTSSVEIRDDIPGSLMVSKGHLLVGAESRVPAGRVPALIAHEVGTHVLTYYNGCAQPLRQLRFGLAGYEPLQEGLAVFSEWLVGGLSRARMRTLAARVLAAKALIDGADFIQTHGMLTARAGLSARAAFNVAVRIHRGGGFSKDMVYLRGLRDLLAHLKSGGPFWPLFIGKVALEDMPALEALRERGVLKEPPLRPRYAYDSNALARLDRARLGLTVLDLLN